MCYLERLKSVLEYSKEMKEYNPGEAEPLIMGALFESKNYIKSLSSNFHITIVIPINFFDKHSLDNQFDSIMLKAFLSERIIQMNWLNHFNQFTWDILVTINSDAFKYPERLKKLVKQCAFQWQKQAKISVQILTRHMEYRNNLFPGKKITTNFSTIYSLWLACQVNKGKKNHFLILDNCKNESHISQIGFAINTLLNNKAKIVYGRQRFEPSYAEKIFTYICSNVFPNMELKISSLGIKIIHSEILNLALEDELFLDANICSDIALQICFYLKEKTPVSEFPLYELNTHNEVEPFYREETNTEIFNYLKTLKKLYRHLGQKDDWNKSFISLIKSLDFPRFENLLSQCPKEILERNIKDLENYKGVTAFELAALSCETEVNREEIPIAIAGQHEALPKITDCWYESDDFDAICIHGTKNEICPISLPIKLSNKGVIFNPQIIEIDFENLYNSHPSIVKNINKSFNSNLFSSEPSLPISVGFLENKEEFSKWGPPPQAQNLPVKMPFTEYRLPQELAQFREALQTVANYWHSINPKYADYYYCYLSVAQSNVPPNCYQRRGHLHSDGFQSAWLKTDLFSDFSFIVSDTPSTEFYLQSFDVALLDPARDNYFKYFKRNMVVKPTRLRQPYEIIAMDAYTLHKAMKNNSQNTIRRTFIRIMYSVIRWQSNSNAHNSMFKYKWPRRKRTLLSKLM